MMYGLFSNTYDYYEWHDLICVADSEEKLRQYAIDNNKNVLEGDNQQEHDNEVIEKCAKVCESSDRHRGEYFATKIRALKT